jgi:predicted Na+-dependent transporter
VSPYDAERKLSISQLTDQNREVAVLLAFIGCYGVMPSIAMLIGKAFQLEPSLAAGLVLVACINGAQASNLCKLIP